MPSFSIIVALHENVTPNSLVSLPILPPFALNSNKCDTRAAICCSCYRNCSSWHAIRGILQTKLYGLVSLPQWNYAPIFSDWRAIVGRFRTGSKLSNCCLALPQPPFLLLYPFCRYSRCNGVRRSEGQICGDKVKPGTAATELSSNKHQHQQNNWDKFSSDCS